MLDLTGTYSELTAGGFQMAIDSASRSTLKFGGSAAVGQPLVINSTLQTLEIGARQ